MAAGGAPLVGQCGWACVDTPASPVTPPWRELGVNRTAYIQPHPQARSHLPRQHGSIMLAAADGEHMRLGLGLTDGGVVVRTT